MSKLTPREILTAGAVVPVMAIDDLSTAVDLSHALVEGGIPTLEITLRTPVGLDAIRLIAKEVPNAIVGAGTVTNPEQLKAVEDAGAVFAISPGLHESLAKASHNSGIPLIPGVALRVKSNWLWNTASIPSNSSLPKSLAAKPCSKHFTALMLMFASARPAASAWQLHPSTWHYLMSCALVAHG